MTRDEFEEFFRLSLAYMFEFNRWLFIRDLKEECINCAFLLILKEVFEGKTGHPEHSFDLEYDNLRWDPKDIEGETRRPDILVHVRGETFGNFLFLEAKKEYLNKGDRKKVIAALGEGFEYEFAVALEYRIKGKKCRYWILQKGEDFETRKHGVIHHIHFAKERKKLLIRPD